MNSVALIASEGSTVGSGHLMRMHALREIIQDTCSVVLVTRSASMPIDVGSMADTYSAVVIDDYTFPRNSVDALTNAEVRTIVIDDFGRTDYGAHTVVHHLPGTTTQTCGADGVHVLSGSRALLLRREICEATWSGVDPTVVVGFGMSSQGIALAQDLAERLRDSLGRDVVIELSELIPPMLTAGQIARHLASASLLVCSASTLALEGLEVGIPICCGTFVDNQQQNYRAMLKHNNVIGLGHVNSENMDTCIEKIQFAYHNKAKFERGQPTTYSWRDKQELWKHILGVQ